MKLLIQLVREILHLSGKSQEISETSGCGNHEYVDSVLYVICTISVSDLECAIGGLLQFSNTCSGSFWHTSNCVSKEKETRK